MTTNHGRAVTQGGAMLCCLISLCFSLSRVPQCSAQHELQMQCGFLDNTSGVGRGYYRLSKSKASQASREHVEGAKQHLSEAGPEEKTGGATGKKDCTEDKQSNIEERAEDRERRAREAREGNAAGRRETKKKKNPKENKKSPLCHLQLIERQQDQKEG